MTVEHVKEILKDRISFLQGMIDAGTDFQDGYEHEQFAVKMVLRQIEREEEEEQENGQSTL